MSVKTIRRPDNKDNKDRKNKEQGRTIETTIRSVHCSAVDKIYRLKIR